MKKLFAMVAAAGMLFVTSCAKDAAESYAEGNDGVVTFTLGLERGLTTRAISDGTGTDQLVYQVFDASGNPMTGFEQETKEVQVWPTSATLHLVKGKTYQIAFWAQNSECTAYNTEDLKAVTVDYNGALNNDETRDAFFKTETFTVSGSTQNISVLLRRPFAQINVGVTADDFTRAKSTGLEIKTSNMNVTGGYSTINLLNGNVSDPVPASFDFSEILDTDEHKLKAVIDGEEQEFVWLSMSYLLVPQEKTTLEKLSFAFHPKTGSDFVFTEGLNNAPVQRNWRTNILGNILTGEINFTIDIDPIYDGDYNYPEFEAMPNGVSYDADTKAFHISTASGLKWFADITNAETISSEHIKEITGNGNFAKNTVYLEEDIDLSEYSNWTPVNTKFDGIFDGQDHTVSNLTVSTEGTASAGLFAGYTCTIQNVKLTNVDIKGHYKTGAIAGDGVCVHIKNCHVDGGSIVVTPYEKDDANNVGGIVGYLSAEGTASVEDCSVSNMTISAYRKVGGLIGYAGGATLTITGNTVTNVDVIADMTPDYVKPYAADAGEIVGAIGNSYVLDETNKAENVTVSVLEFKENVLEIGTVEELKALAAAVNAGSTFAKKTVKLTADLDLENEPWTPIGNGSNAFQGIFDGQQKTISNLYVHMPGRSYAGLFGNTKNGEIKNLNVKNADIEGRLSVGTVSGQPYTTKFSNIKVTGKVTVDGFAYVGGVLGRNAYADCSDITVDVEPGSYVKSYSTEDNTAYRNYVGGVIGFSGEGGHSYTNLKSNIDVYGTTCDIGGIIGIAHYNNKFVNCSSSGKVTVTHAAEKEDYCEVGGIAGVWHNADGTTVSFTGCEFTGTLVCSSLSGEELEAWQTRNAITGDAYSKTGTGQLFIDDLDVTAEHQR